MALLWLLLLTAAAQAAPRKVMLFLGGSGDPPGETTIFDEYAATYRDFAHDAGWETTAVYDGSHATSRLIFGVDTPSFTPDHARAAMASIDLKKGDELLIVVENHGSPRSGDQKTHSVTTEESHYSLDELGPLLTRLGDKGVKTAIVDASCFSGASQALASAHTCVVSQAAATREGFSTPAFPQAFQAGRSLEDAYLAARRNDQTAELPEISTPAGRRTAQQLRSLLDHTYTAEPEEKPCATETPDQLEALVQNLKDILARSADPSQLQGLPESFLVSMLWTSLQNYDDALAKHELRFREFEALSNKPSGIPILTTGEGKLLTLGDVDVLHSEPKLEEKLRGMLRADLDDPLKKASSEETLKALDALDRLADGPELKAIHEMRENLWKKGQAPDLYAPAQQVAMYERIVYARLYEKNKTAEKEEPCASFSL